MRRRPSSWIAAVLLACELCVAAAPLVAPLLAAPAAEARTKKKTTTKKPATKRTPKRTTTRRRVPKPVPAPVGPNVPPVGKPFPVQSLPPADPKKVTSEDIADQQQQIDALREEARKNRDLAARLRGKEKSVAKDLQRIQRDLTTTQRYLRQLEARETIVQGKKAITERDLAAAINRREAQRATLSWRLREIYKFGRDRRLEALLSSASFAGLVQRGDFFQRILDADRALLGEIQGETQRIEGHKRQLEGTIKELTAISGEKTVESKRLSSLQQEQARTLAGITSQRKSAEETARQMEASARRIQNFLAQLERRRREAEEAARRAAQGTQTPGTKTPKAPPPSDDKFLADANFAKNRGSLSWPVRGSLVGSFGRNVSERFNTVTFNNGIDIAAPAGTDVRAVARGRVELSEYLPGYGKTIILNHGDGYYTIYGYCSALLAGSGAEVQPGQVIARVGDTDSVKGPALHFEVRKGKEAQDPQGWLR